jgi:hypothetical protein
MSRTQDIERIEAELDASAVVTALVRGDVNGADVVLDNAGNWRLMAFTLAAWLAQGIRDACSCGDEACIEMIRADVMNHLRRAAGPEPPEGPDGPSTDMY